MKFVAKEYYLSPPILKVVLFPMELYFVLLCDFCLMLIYDNADKNVHNIRLLKKL